MSFTSFKPRGVCSRNIDIEVEGSVIKDVRFTGGCDGNLKAISKLIKGRQVQEVIDLLEGNTCGPRNTSCADQLAQGLKEHLQ